MADSEEPSEWLQPMPCWLADHGEELWDSVVVVQDGMTAWSGYDGTLPQAVDSWLEKAEQHVRESSSIGDDEEGLVTPRRSLDVLVDVKEHRADARVSCDLLDRLTYYLEKDLGLAVPAREADRVAYVLTWAARLSVDVTNAPAEEEALEERPRIPRWTPPTVENQVPREELRLWARAWPRRRR